MSATRFTFACTACPATVGTDVRPIVVSHVCPSRSTAPRGRRAVEMVLVRKRRPVSA